MKWLFYNFHDPPGGISVYSFYKNWHFGLVVPVTDIVFDKFRDFVDIYTGYRRGWQAKCDFFFNLLDVPFILKNFNATPFFLSFFCWNVFHDASHFFYFKFLLIGFYHLRHRMLYFFCATISQKSPLFFIMFNFMGWFAPCFMLLIMM